jgi:hypothetical protein
METDFDDPNEGKRATHFTVGELPWKVCVPGDGMTQEMRDDCLTDGVIAKHIDRVIQEMVERTDRAAMGLPELLEGVTPENVHPEYNPAYECEDSEGEED